jgi:hypothetical protein
MSLRKALIINTASIIIKLIERITDLQIYDYKNPARGVSLK